MSENWNQSLTNLNTLLAGMVPFKEEAFAIAQKAGLRVEQISFSDKPMTTWFYIIRQAELQGKLASLIHTLEEQFGPSPVFLRAHNDVFDSILGPDRGRSFPEWASPPESPDNHEKIIGRESTLLPIHFLETGLEKSRPVARIVTPAGIGTGFLTSGNLMVTNNHVIDQVSTARQSYAEFNYQKTASGLDREPEVVDFDPDSLFHTSPADDWTVVRMKDNPVDTWGCIPLGRNSVKKNQRVSIIQHPGGGEKQIALHHNYVRYADDSVVQYLTDTLNGSSGSPVFDHDWQVVALHHAGGYIREPGTKRYVFRNEGISINRILDGLAAAGISPERTNQA